MKLKFQNPRLSDQNLQLSIPMHYGFMSGVLLHDESQNTNDGTATNGPTPAYPGFNFDIAATQHITFGDMTGTGTVQSIVAWVSVNAGAAKTIVDVNDASANAFFRLAADETLVAGTDFSGANIFYINGVVSAGVVPTATWTQVAMTATVGIALGTQFLISSTNAFLDFGDILAGVRCYSTVLTPAEILSHYHLTRWRYSV